MVKGRYIFNKKIFAPLLLLAVLIIIGSISFYKNTNNVEEQKAEKENVLGHQAPQIYISGGESAYRSGGMIALTSTDEPAVNIRGYNITGEFEVSVYEADEKALLDYLTHDEKGNQINKSPNVNDFRFIKKLNHKINASNGEDSKLLLPLEESGIYFLRMKQGDISADSFVIRSKNGAIVKEGDNEYIFWGQNYKNRKSISEGSLTLYNLQDEVKEVGSTTFNESGIAKTALTADADIALIRDAGDKVIIPINLQYLNTGYRYQSFQPKERITKFFIFTDRPLYRPGDTIFFKSIIRDDDDARYTIPSGLANVKLYDGWGDESLIVERSIPITGSGSVDGEFELSENADTGYYRLVVSVPDGNSSSTSFEVEHFRKPEYTIDVSTSKTEFIAGEKSSFTISGNYFSGHPLANQTVEYKIYSGDFYEYEYQRDIAQQLNDDYRYGYWGGSVLDQGEAKLDKDGNAEIEIETEIPADKNKSQVYAVEATYKDQTGNPVFTRKNILVYSGEYGIYRNKGKGYRVKVGEELVLPITLVSHRNTEVGNIEVTATIQRENWVKYQDKDKKYPSYRKEVEEITPLKVKTNSSGEAEFSLKPKKPGSYLFTVKGKDERGNTITKVFRSYVSSDSESYYYSDKNNDLTIQADKESYSPSESVRFTITSNTPDRDVFLSLERGRTNRFQIVEMKGTSTVVEVPLVSTDMPNIFAKVSSFSDHALDSGSTNVKVSIDSKKLIVNVVPNQEKYGPGETVTLNVSTTDVGGGPVSADVAVWAVDKAIFELADDQNRKILDTFWSERRNNTQESHSLAGITVYGAEMGGGCFAAGTKILMADGSEKPIEKVKKGDYVLTKESENSSKLVKAKVDGTHKINELGYLIFNNDLRVTANHKLWINESWRDAGSAQIGDIMLNSDGNRIEIESIEWLSGNFNVYNLSIDKYHTYFANNLWVHNQKGAPRTVFKDTAYWNPSVRTNESGRAQISFKLPDNLTTWVVAGIGATSDTRVGQTTNEIIVTKDVIVRPILPNILRVGDEIVMSALVQNSTEEDQKFDIDFEFNDGSIESATKTGELIKSKSTKQIYWNTQIISENENAKLTYSAISQTNEKASDTIVQEIPVREFGFNEVKAETGDGDKTYEIKLSEDSHQDKSSITLSLAPTILGTLPTAMNYLIDYPYGCVEQTTSRLVPAIIAKANADIFAIALQDKDIDEIIENGLKRLEDHQGNDGGWAWWGNGDSDPFVTAYVVEYLVLAKETGIEVDEDMLEKAKTYLEREYYVDESGNRKNYMQEGKDEDLIMKIYALTLLEAEDKLTQFNNFDDLEPDLLSYAVMLNYMQGDKNPKTNGLSRLVSMAKSQGDGVYWEAGNSERFASKDTSTALAIRAITLAEGDRELAVKGSKYLIRNRNHDYWSNTFATAQVVRSIVELSKTGDELTPSYSFTVDLDGERIAQGNVNSSRQIVNDIEIPVKDVNKNGSKLTIKKNGNGQIYSTLLTKEFHTDRDAKAIENGLKITRKYINDKGERYSLAVGDTVTVELTVSGLGAEENYGVIEDELPSGMIPINQSFKNEQAFKDDSYYTYGLSNREITENGMVLSLRRVSAGESTYTYKARVISEGKFSVPPATVSLMYAPEINGRTDAETLKITKESKLSPGEVVKESLLRGSRAMIFSGLIVLILIVAVIIIFRRRGITRFHVKEKIKSIINRLKRKPPIPPIENASANEKLQNDAENEK